MRFKHKFTLPMILTLLVVAIAVLIIGFLNLHQQTTQPSNSNSSAIGVELTQDVDYVDLHKLEKNGISFIYLKSTQGRSYFDENYLSYRDQVLGTNLAFGTEIRYSNESTPRQQYEFFIKQVGLNTGTLPIMVVPAVKLKKGEVLALANFVKMLQDRGKSVLVAINYRYHQLFLPQTQFISTGQKQPDKTNYSFWRYTTNGHVQNVDGLEKQVTMFMYNGTAQQYKQKYGQLTQ